MLDLLWPGIKLIAPGDAAGLAFAKEHHRAFRIQPDLPHYLAKLSSLSNHIGSKLKTKFPGTQPVSFQREHLYEVSQPGAFYVCEKSDGQRYLLLFFRQQCLLINTKLEFFLLPSTTSTSDGEGEGDGTRDARFQAVEDTLLDGELVLDGGGQHGEADNKRANFYIFDSLHFTNLNVMDQHLDVRLRMVISRNVLSMCPSASLHSLRLKKMYLAPASEYVLQQELEHESDGLIFTRLHHGYTAGRSSEILKWKPAEMNSVDFVVKPVTLSNKTARFAQLFWQEQGVLKPYPGEGGGNSASYIYLSDEDEERVRLAQNQLGEDRHVVCECSFEPGWFTIDVTSHQDWDAVLANKQPNERGAWKFMRFRLDKTLPNSSSTVRSVVDSIRNPVTKQELFAALLEGEQATAASAKRVKLG